MKGKFGINTTSVRKKHEESQMELHHQNAGLNTLTMTINQFGDLSNQVILFLWYSDQKSQIII